MRPAKLLFWASSALIVHTHVGYPALLWLLARGRPEPRRDDSHEPAVSVIVASDDSGDATVERARRAGADLVLDLPRGGKVRAQDQAVERASGELLVFTDANALLAPGAVRKLVARFGGD